MTARERWLRWILRIAALVILTALGATVMPHSWMDATHRHLGLGELPEMPIVGYLTRSASLLYAWHGALLLYISFDVRRFLGIIRFLAALGIAFGAFMIVLDWAVGMPLWWTLGEGPSIIVSSALIGWLAVGAGRTPARGNGGRGPPAQSPSAQSRPAPSAPSLSAPSSSPPARTDTSRPG